MRKLRGSGLYTVDYAEEGEEDLRAANPALPEITGRQRESKVIIIYDIVLEQLVIEEGYQKTREKFTVKRY